jgi:protein-S-isoprenylcysteine O-methyltransferase Ste14
LKQSAGHVAEPEPMATAQAGRHETRDSFFVRSGKLFFRYRNGIAPAVLLILLVLSRPRQPLGSAALDRVLDVAGLAISAAGEAFRIAVIGYAYIIRGGKGRQVYAEDLVTDGFFAAARNPLYLGNLLIYLGLFIMWNSPWMYVLGVSFFIFMYTSLVAAEEAFLIRKFGPAYEAYCRDVPRWLPNLWRVRSGVRGMAFNWRRVVLKEYGTVAAWLLTAGVLLIAETFYFASGPERAQQAATIGAFMAAVIAMWGYARWLKRTRRLHA